MSVVENPHRFKDPKAQAISNKWFPLQEIATIGQKNKVGLIYISKFLRLGDEVASKFEGGEYNAYHAVGMKQSGIPMDTDVTPFWNEVKVVFPDLHSDEDISFLCKDGGVLGVLEFTYHLDPVFTGEFPMLRRISLNASDYK